MALVMDRETLNTFLVQEFAQVARDFTVDSVTEDRLVARLRVSDAHLRPGGTISGPAMFALADLGIYTTILSKIGPVMLSVTTSATIDFLRKPIAGRDLVAKCRLLKLGRVLAVGDALIYSDGQADPVARSSMTYSVPPRR